MKKLNKYPIKAASLMILRELHPERQIEKKSSFNYEILFLKRAAKMAFSNVYAFPGGKLDAEDTHISWVQKVNKFRICAVRETLEESGIFLLNNSFNSYQDMLKKLDKAANYFVVNNFQACNFQALASQIYPEYRDQHIREFMRLVTAPYLPARFDTQFFISFIKQNDLIQDSSKQTDQQNWNVNQCQAINWAKFLEDGPKGLYNFDDVLYNTDEATDAMWLSPTECLSNFYKKKIDLANPQILILNILTSFNTINQVSEFLSRKVEKPLDKYQENPFTFPHLFGGKLTKQFNKDMAEKYPYTLVMPGDEHYPIDYVLEQEKEPELNQELRQKLQGLEQRSSKNKSRIFMPEFKNFFIDDFHVEVDQELNSPVSYLKSRSAIQEILQREQLI